MARLLLNYIYNRHSVSMFGCTMDLNKESAYAIDTPPNNLMISMDC